MNMKKMIFIFMLAIIANFAFSQSQPDTTYEYYFLTDSPIDSTLFYKNVYHYDLDGKTLYINNIYKEYYFYSFYLVVKPGDYITYFDYDESNQVRNIFMLNENTDTIFKQSFNLIGNDLEYVYQIQKNGKLINYARYYYYNIRNRVSTSLLNEALNHINDIITYSYYHSDSIDIELFDTSTSQYNLISKIYFSYLSNNMVQKCIQSYNSRVFTLDLSYDNNQRCNAIECSLTILDSCSDKYWYFTETFNENGQSSEISKMPYDSSCYKFQDFYGVKENYYYGENKDLMFSKVYWNNSTNHWTIYTSKYYKYNSTRINNIKRQTISIFPNPVNDNLTIKNEEIPIKEVCFYNILGQKVKQVSVNSCETTLDVSSLPIGMYIAKIKTEAGILTRKVQIMR